MTADKWRIAWRIYSTAREMALPQRRSFLDSATTDPEILDEVLLLLERSEGSTIEPSPPPEAIPPIGSRIERYTLLRELGRGGMGSVYAAADQELDRVVALKFLSPDAISSPSAAQLVREAKTLSSLNHPNIVTVYDVLQSGQTFAIAMELIDGKPLRQLCGTGVDAGRVIGLGLQIGQALAAAHEHGVVHRDIKPENIFIRNDGYVKLLDFGLARTVTANDSASVAGLLAGTLRYMSPEQLRGEPASPASDIFSFGLVLYELATGHHPFRASSPLETAHAIGTQTPRAPSAINSRIPPVLDRLILSMLAKEAGARPSTNEVVESLQSQLVTDRDQPPKVPHLKRTTIFLTGLGVAVALSVLVWFFWNRESDTFADLTVQPLTSQAGWEEYPALSPDGRRVAFTWSSQLDGHRDIYIKEVDGDRLTRLDTSALKEGKGEVAQLLWSPDGRRIAFKRSLEQFGRPGIIDSVGLDGREERKLADLTNSNFSSGIDWSPDGTRLAFSDTPPNTDQLAIYTFDLRTGEKRKVTSPPSATWGDWDPHFSPDGASLAFKRVTDFWADDLYLIPAAGGTPQRLSSGTGGIWGHSWTQDGRHVIASCQRSSILFGLWLFSPGRPSQPARLIQGGSDSITPTSARKSSRIGWVNKIEDLNIYRIATSGNAQPTKLIASTLRDWGARYSQAGWIAFISDRTGDREIWLASPDGSRQVQATNLDNRWIGNLQWSPDGKRLAFDSRQREYPSVFMMDCDLQTLRCEQPQRVTSGAAALYPNWSADGRFLYFGSNRSGRWEIWKKPVAGGDAVQVTTSGALISQESTDGRYLYFMRESGTSIWRISVAPSDGSSATEEEIVKGETRRIPPEGPWAVAGDEVFFLGHFPEKQSTVIYAHNTITQKTRLILTLPPVFAHRYDTSLSVSADGRWILYSQLDRSGSNVMIASTRR